MTTTGRGGTRPTSTIRRLLDLAVLPYLAAAAVTAVLTAYSLKLWRADWSVPFWYDGDALAVAAHFKTVLETGWYESQPLLGAPWGQIYHAFPTADNLNFAAARLFTLVLGDWAVAMNAYFVVGFVLIALTSVFALTRMGVSRVLSVVLATLYALAPYHFVRNENHLWLASYFMLPLALWVVWMIATGRPLWQRRESARNRVVGLLTGRGAGVFVVLALTSTSSTYYGFFTIILVAVVGLAAFWRSRSSRAFGGAVAAGVVLAVAAVANMAPDLIWSAQNASDGAGLVRSPVETEYYSFKLTQLLLPVPGHHVQALADLREFYDRFYPFPSESPALGIVAAVGTLALLVLAVSVLLGRRRPSPGASPVDSDAHRTLRALAGLVVVSFLFGTLGGFSSLLSLITSDLRGWNRVQIVIMFFALAAVGLIVDLVLRRVVVTLPRPRLAAPVATGLVAVVLLGGGWYDQTTAGAIPLYQDNAAAFQLEDDFFSEVQAEVGDGASVLQLPYVDFPEASTPNGLSYTQTLKPYLHTTTVNWSAGGIKGRTTSEWPDVIEDYAPSSIVQQLALIDFDAVLVDRSGYTDNGAGLEAGLRDAAGAPVLESTGLRWALYLVPADLQARADALPAAARAALSDAVTDPVVARPVNTDPATGGRDDQNGVVLQNDRDESVSGTLVVDLGTRAGVDSVVVLGPDGTRRVFTATDNSAEVTVPVTVSPGTTTITILGSDDGGATALPESAAVGIENAVVVQDALQGEDLVP